MENANLRVLVAYGEQKVIEEGQVEEVVIMEFPSLQEAEGWYNSSSFYKDLNFVILKILNNLISQIIQFLL